MMQKKKHDLSFLKYPLLVCAPMVEQSELPFRMLVRKYCANLCYTPMMNSKMMVNCKNYKRDNFTTCQEDRPLVAQICGNDPDIMLKAGQMLENQVDAIDINLGCPQAIAKRGHYGSYLLQDTELVQKIVSKLSNNLKVPLFCKIRVLKSQQKTIQLVKKIVSAGCSLLTVHGRIKQQNKDTMGSCNWNIIKTIQQNVDIPVVANGGVYRYQDIDICLQETHAVGVMSAESLLENPALFSNQILCLDGLALEYLNMVEKYLGASDSIIKAHLFKMLFKGLQMNIDLRQRMTKAVGLGQFRQIALQLKERRVNLTNQEKFGWYLRYWKKDRDDDNKYPDGIHLAPKFVKKLQNQQLTITKTKMQENKVEEQVE